IREIGNVSYLPDIFDIYHQNISEEVKKEIYNLISDIKDNKAAPHIVNFIEKIEKEEDISLFTASCWRSRIDFCEYVEFFIKLVIRGSYQTSIEAFTVIENCMHGLSQETINNQIDILKKSISTIQTEKKPFIAAIIKTLQV
ncbi:MAG: hypothetical protein JXB17_08720, partial [Bacteroidales bacterium]|nr:hypothetical protein [Bacteroidales bacterium]